MIYDKDNFEYKEPIWFHIPAIFDINALFPFQKSFYNYLIQHPDRRKNTNFVVYGCPCSCTWNGGRLMYEPVYSIETVEEMFFNYINNLDMNIQLTFTNRLLEERDMYDRLGNALLSVANSFPKGQIQVLVSSKILIDHIKENYPNIELVRSATMVKKEITEEEQKIFDAIVLPKWHNKNFNLIKELSKNNELEILCDEPCITDCPRQISHYEAYNVIQLFGKTGQYLTCDQPKHPSYNELWVLPSEINDYIDLGVTHFKLSGRESIFHMIESISLFAFKKEHQASFRMSGAYENLLYIADREERRKA